MKKLNCWEYRKCTYSEKCIVSKEVSLDGINGGYNGGRCCWIVRYILGNEFTAPCILDNPNCRECEFYKKVHDEESLYL